MTQPSMHTTFDTSLIDLNPNFSFSTTESDPSDAGMSSTTPKVQNPETRPVGNQGSNQDILQELQPIATKMSTPVQHIGTQEAYDQWASVYDSDGNMLQSIDDDELDSLLPSLLDQIAAAAGTRISVLDLGCGTGRNTARLLRHAWPADRSVAVTGLDFSAGMLQLARAKLALLTADDKDASSHTSLRLEQCNPFPSSNDFAPATVQLPHQNLVLSTLVLEHVPLLIFFTSLAALLAPGGMALVTNMHDEMGGRSQAGFVNAQGVKVRGESFVYSLAETVRAAADAGLECVQVKERSVGEEDVESGVVGKRGAKWIGCRVWYGTVLRKV